MIVCPKPNQWAKIYRKLNSAVNSNNSVQDAPPIPLILTGWNYSNDLQKKLRWESTINWAENHDLEHIINQLEYSDYYIVEELDTSEVLTLGGYLNSDWDFDPKRKPSPDEIEKAITNLKENWGKISGSKLALISHPVCFTGKKKRRLVVAIKPNTKPPWGDWYSLSKSEFPEKFTLFRKAVNREIDPVYVDHIDFIEKEE